MILEDGKGGGKKAWIDDNNLVRTFAIQYTRGEHATELKSSWVFGSGLITITSVDEQGLLYFKNGETSNFHMERLSVALGPTTGGVNTDASRIRLYRNPTTGTLIDVGGTTDASIKQNRNFGSTDTLSALSLLYKGDASSTVTDGDVVAETFIASNTNVGFSSLPVDFILSNNDSIAVTIEAQDSNTSMKVLVSLYGYFNGDS